MGLFFITSFIKNTSIVVCLVQTATLLLAFQLAHISRILLFSMHSAASQTPWWSRASFC